MKSITQFIHESLEKELVEGKLDSANESKKHPEEEMDESMNRFMSRESKEPEED